MTKWFAWFQAEPKVPVLRVLAAKDLGMAEMIARDLAERDKVELIGVIIASELWNPPIAEETVPE